MGEGKADAGDSAGVLLEPPTAGDKIYEEIP